MAHMEQLLKSTLRIFFTEFNVVKVQTAESWQLNSL